MSTGSGVLVFVGCGVTVADGMTVADGVTVADGITGEVGKAVEVGLTSGSHAARYIETRLDSAVLTKLRREYFVLI
jgi:UDP-3-O-[3-hydroxymyristoyl] glucosamine N-acyltransferase